MTKTLIPALALAALGTLTLTACGGTTSSTPASSSAAAPDASATSAATEPSAAASSSAADTPSTSTAVAGDPCKALSASEVSTLTGVKVGEGKGGGLAGSKLCSWAGGKAGSSSYVVFTAQEGAAQGGSMEAVGDQLKTQFGGTISTATVTGADEAIYLSGTKSGLVIDVLAKRGDVFYQVVATAPDGSSEKHKDGVFKVVEALVAG